MVLQLKVHPHLQQSPDTLLFCPSGEHIAGQATGHLPAKRREAEKSTRTVPRHQTSDVSVAIVALSSSDPPPFAPSLTLPRHCYHVLPPTMDQRLTHLFCF